MEWTAEAILERLEGNPDLRTEDLIRERVAEKNRSYRAVLREFRSIASQVKYRERFAALAKEQDEDLAYGMQAADPADAKAVWIETFLRTRNQNEALAIAGVKAKELRGWYTPGHPLYDADFAERYEEAWSRVVLAHEDDIQTARRMAIASGDAKTLGMISARALESLHAAKWGRSRLEISGTVKHDHMLNGATHAQLAERTERLLAGGEPEAAAEEDEAIEAEYAEVPS